MKPPNMGGFPLGPKTKETPKSSNPIGRELIWTQGVYIGVRAKARVNKVALKWHHFPTNSHLIMLKRTFILV